MGDDATQKLSSADGEWTFHDNHKTQVSNVSTPPSPSLLACLHKFLPHPHVYKCISPDFKLIVIRQNYMRLEGTLLSCVL